MTQVARALIFFGGSLSSSLQNIKEFVQKSLSKDKSDFLGWLNDWTNHSWEGAFPLVLAMPTFAPSCHEQYPRACPNFISDRYAEVVKTTTP